LERVRGGPRMRDAVLRKPGVHGGDIVPQPAAAHGAWSHQSWKRSDV
jgi:hypothetical protein